MAISKTRQRLRAAREVRIRARVKIEREEHELCARTLASTTRDLAAAQAALEAAVVALGEAEAEHQHAVRGERDALVRLVRALMDQRGWSIAETGRRVGVTRDLAHRAATSGASVPTLRKMLAELQRGAS